MIFLSLGFSIHIFLWNSKARVPQLPSWRANPYYFALAASAFYLIAKYSSFFLHEWSHTTVAYLLGVIDKNPLNIDYGTDWTLRGINDGMNYPPHRSGDLYWFETALSFSPRW